MPEFTRLISEITDINNLIPDPKQIGGGMHQILPGGFLDVHIDFNFHPELKLHRHLNLLLYLNKDWKREYEGCLELWFYFEVIRTRAILSPSLSEKLELSE